MNMEFLLNRVPAVRPPNEDGSLRVFRADFVVRDDSLVAVTNLRRGASGWFAETSVTMERENGEIDLVGYVIQAVPADEAEAVSYFERNWPHLRMVFKEAPLGLSLKEALRDLSQMEISSLAALHLDHHQLDQPTDHGVLPKTARMWHLLQQFGSFRPAEVIAFLLGEKVPTIHARINLSRVQGLIPPAERLDSKKQRKIDERKNT